MTDIARYDTESPGEPTQGAGAVAMLVSENPSILALDDVPEAVYTYENMDFWRPLYRSKAIVEGQQSISSYLHGLDQTYMQYKEGSGYDWDDYRYLLFHVPFPKMAYKGFKRLFQKEVMRVNGHGTEELNAEFEQKVEPGLWANTEIGNIYTGSFIFLSPHFWFGHERTLPDSVSVCIPTVAEAAPNSSAALYKTILPPGSVA